VRKIPDHQVSGGEGVQNIGLPGNSTHPPNEKNKTMTTDDAKENGQEPRVTVIEFLTSLRALLEDHESRIEELEARSETQGARIDELGREIEGLELEMEEITKNVDRVVEIVSELDGGKYAGFLER
jgi:uncharacterized coiled-coil protein SlyX